MSAESQQWLAEQLAKRGPAPAHIVQAVSEVRQQLIAAAERRAS